MPTCIFLWLNSFHGLACFLIINLPFPCVHLSGKCHVHFMFIHMLAQSHSKSLADSASKLSSVAWVPPNLMFYFCNTPLKGLHLSTKGDCMDVLIDPWIFCVCTYLTPHSKPADWQQCVTFLCFMFWTGNLGVVWRKDIALWHYSPVASGTSDTSLGSQNIVYFFWYVKHVDCFTANHTKNLEDLVCAKGLRTSWRASALPVNASMHLFIGNTYRYHTMQACWAVYGMKLLAQQSYNAVEDGHTYNVVSIIAVCVWEVLASAWENRVKTCSRSVCANDKHR